MPRTGRGAHSLALRSEDIRDVAAELHPLGARRVTDDHRAALSCELITHNRFCSGWTAPMTSTRVRSRDVDGATARLAAGPWVNRASAILTKHRNP